MIQSNEFQQLTPPVKGFAINISSTASYRRHAPLKCINHSVQIILYTLYQNFFSSSLQQSSLLQKMRNISITGQNYLALFFNFRVTHINNGIISS